MQAENDSGLVCPMKFRAEIGIDFDDELLFEVPVARLGKFSADLRSSEAMAQRIVEFQPDYPPIAGSLPADTTSAS